MTAVVASVAAAGYDAPAVDCGVDVAVAVAAADWGADGVGY